jgi:putative membrane protein
MVKHLSKAHKEVVAKAVAQAEQQTKAELVAVIAPASDAYLSYVMLYGLALGSIVATGLWLAHVMSAFPMLLVVQLGIMSALLLAPPLHKLCLRLVPRRIRHRRAAHRAYEEYLIVSRHVSASTPIVLFYVSLAERYAHILPSRMVREKIPDKEWSDIIIAFTAAMRSQNLDNACTTAIERMTALLAPQFPL